MFGGGNSFGSLSVLCQVESQILFFLLIVISYNSVMYCNYFDFNACVFSATPACYSCSTNYLLAKALSSRSLCL